MRTHPVDMCCAKIRRNGDVPDRPSAKNQDNFYPVALWPNRDLIGRHRLVSEGSEPSEQRPGKNRVPGLQASELLDPPRQLRANWRVQGWSNNDKLGLEPLDSRAGGAKEGAGHQVEFEDEVQYPESTLRFETTLNYNGSNWGFFDFKCCLINIQINLYLFTKMIL
jgi:hypothetical protein